ncbi:AMP-dependent synthetase/ligase [Penicillium brevicompactum]|uniref:AMP-dependent synthetase/ligase n=1 Tax=Penicillium brevicompactum TaxID=5074 RepID=A0A9W9QPT2_PENBR|nr:AMP-dependent synthetase/ligase [Penicillium brevicompactum]
MAVHVSAKAMVSSRKQYEPSLTIMQEGKHFMEGNALTAQEARPKRHEAIRAKQRSQPTQSLENRAPRPSTMVRMSNTDGYFSIVFPTT